MIVKQIPCMEAKLCHFTSFGHNTPSKAVQGHTPYWHLLPGFEDLVSEESGYRQALVGTCQTCSLRQTQMLLCSPQTDAAGQAGKGSGFQSPGPC